MRTTAQSARAMLSSLLFDWCWVWTPLPVVVVGVCNQIKGSTRVDGPGNGKLCEVVCCLLPEKVCCKWKLEAGHIECSHLSSSAH